MHHISIIEFWQPDAACITVCLEAPCAALHRHDLAKSSQVVGILSVLHGNIGRLGLCGADGNLPRLLLL